MQRILLSQPFLLLSLLFALPALAGNWGEDWGTLTWGAAIAAVPTMGWLGGALLVGLLVGVGIRRKGGRAGAALGLLLALGYAPVAEAQTVSVPNTLSNGSVAEADAMNENFEALRNAVGVTVPNTFVNGTPADANEVNANFQALKTGVETCLANAAAAAAGNQAVCESVGGTWAGTTCTAAPCDVTSNDAAVAAAAAAAVDITTDNAAAYADGVGSVDITTDNAAVAAAAAAAVDITSDNQAVCESAGGTWGSPSAYTMTGGVSFGTSTDCDDGISYLSFETCEANCAANDECTLFMHDGEECCLSSLPATNFTSPGTWTLYTKTAGGDSACSAADITTDNEAMCTNAGGTYDPDGGVNAYCADDSFTVNEGTISGDGELVLLDNQHADISAADLGDWGTSSFDLALSIKANSGTSIASDGDYAVLFARSQESGSPWTGPMAFVWNDGQVLFRLRGDEGLLLPAGTVSSWSDWVNLRFLHDAATQTIRVFVNGVEAGNRAVTLTGPSGFSHITGAPLRFGGNHVDPALQNLDARIRNIVRVDFADQRCTEFVSLQPLFWDVGITDSCTVDITTDNAAVAQATCTTAGGTWNGGTSTCAPALPTINCFQSGFCHTIDQLPEVANPPFSYDTSKVGPASQSECDAAGFGHGIAWDLAVQLVGVIYDMPGGPAYFGNAGFNSFPHFMCE